MAQKRCRADEAFADAVKIRAAREKLHIDEYQLASKWGACVRTVKSLEEKSACRKKSLLSEAAQVLELDDFRLLVADANETSTIAEDTGRMLADPHVLPVNVMIDGAFFKVTINECELESVSVVITTRAGTQHFNYHAGLSYGSLILHMLMHVDDIRRVADAASRGLYSDIGILSIEVLDNPLAQKTPAWMRLLDAGARVERLAGYDMQGNRVSESEPVGYRQMYKYDVSGRLVESIETSLHPEGRTRREPPSSINKPRVKAKDLNSENDIETIVAAIDKILELLSDSQRQDVLRRLLNRQRGIVYMPNPTI